LYLGRDIGTMGSICRSFFYRELGRREVGGGVGTTSHLGGEKGKIYALVSRSKAL